MSVTDNRLQDISPFAGHSPQQERPLGGYGLLSALYGGAATAFAVYFRRSGRQLPPHMEPVDMALIAVATHKVSRLIAKDRVTSAARAPFTRFQDDAGPGEVEEAARGRGLRRVIGELVICPYCLGLWIAGAFTAGLLIRPRPTRWIASVFTLHFGADALQIAYSKAEDAL